MLRHTEGGTVHHSSNRVQMSATDMRIAAAMFAPFTFFAALLFHWLLVA